MDGDIDVDVTKINKAQAAIILALKENAIEMDYAVIAALGAMFVMNCMTRNLNPYAVMDEVITNLNENIRAGAKITHTAPDKVQ